MKVLHMISGGDSGGAKTHVFTLLNALKTRIGVKIVCFTDGVFYEMLKDENIPYELVRQKGRYDLSVVRRLCALISDEGYDLVHAHGARANFIAANLRRKVRVPIVTTMHSDYLMDFEDNLYKRILFTSLNRFSLRFIDYYLAVSNDFKKMLIRRRFDPGRIFTIYNGIEFFDPTVSQSREEYLRAKGVSCGPDDVFIGILGRFDRVKGLDILIQAAALVKERDARVKFLLAGDGGLRSELESLVQKLGLEDTVYFLGFENQVNDFLNAIDINTLTSRSESFPYALLEGGRMKKATIASRVGGIPDLISDGENGYLFPAGDVSALAERILTLAQDSSLRQCFGQALYNRIRDHFTNDCMASDHIAIYKKVLRRGRKERRVQDAMLMGYYGYDNSGDEALLNVIIHELREKDKNLSLVALTSKPKEAQNDYAIKAINRFNVFSVLGNLRRTRVLIYGGGSLIQDVTSSKSLFYYLSVIYLAKLTHTKIMLYGNGVGPILKEGDRDLVRKVLNRVDVITLRETDSYHELVKMGIDRPKIAITADPAIRVTPAGDARVREILKPYGFSPDDRFFVISVRRWGNCPIESFIARLSQYVCATYGLKPLYIPLHAAKDLAKSRLAWAMSGCQGSVIDRPLMAEEIVGIVQRSQFVIGVRLHMLIYAASVYIPAIGLVYDPKIKSFMHYAGQNSLVDLNRLDEAQVCRYVDDIMQNREEKIHALQHVVKRLQRLAEENSRLAMKLIQEK